MVDGEFFIPLHNDNTALYEAWVELPFFYVWKDYDSNNVAGTLVTYNLTVDNIGHADGSGVTVSDYLLEGLSYISGGSYDAGTGEVSWLLPHLASDEGQAIEFTGQLACQAGLEVINDNYRVTSSDQGITSTVGSPIMITVSAPTIEVSFEASTLLAMEGETVTFTATATTDGTPLFYAWDFDSDGFESGEVVSHTFNTAGPNEVLLTVTDVCGYTATYSLLVEVQSGVKMIYLPLVGR